MARRNKWLLRFVLIFLLVAIPIGLWVAAFLNLGSGLDTTRAKLDATDPGWRLNDIVNAYNKSLPPDEQNSMLVMTRLLNSLPVDYLSWRDNVKLEDWLPDPERNRRPLPHMLKDAETIWAQLKPELKLAHRLEKMPAGGQPVRMAANPLATVIPHVQDSRYIASLLHFDAVMSAQAGNPDQALANIRGGIQGSWAIGSEPYVIAALVRMSCTNLMLDALERTLAWCEPKDEKLADLHGFLIQEMNTPVLTAGLKGERGMYDTVFQLIADDPTTIRQTVSLAGSFPPSSGGKPDLFDMVKFPLHLPADHAFAMETITRYIEISRLPAEQWKAELARVPQPAANDQSRMISRLLLPLVLKSFEAGMQSQAHLRLAVLAVGCERYRRKHGQWPASLRDLVPLVPPVALTDPYDGQPIRYKRRPDGVLLYSVGVDGKDNDGYRETPTRYRDGEDITFQLWDVAQRGLPSRSQ
jgi:hypothetical protein